MNRTILVVLGLLLTNITSTALAQWHVGVTYQHADRGEQWDQTESGPQRGFGVELGKKIHRLSDRASVSGRFEASLQGNAFSERNPFGNPLLETDQRVFRGGVLCQAEFRMSNTVDVYGGLGGGFEHFRQNIAPASETFGRIQWAEPPQDRMETSPYLAGALGAQFNLQGALRPFAEYRRYWTLHGNRGLILARNRITNEFGAFEIGMRFGI